MEKQNIVFLLGNVVDKKEYASINDAVLKDKDIRHLLRTGFFGILAKTIGIIVVCTMMFYNYEKPVFGIALLIPFFYSLFCIISDIRSFVDNIGIFLKYLRCLFSKNRPNSAMALWHYIPGSVQDVQIINTATQLIKDKCPESDVKVVYSGQPYYKPVYIDSITILFKDKFWRCYFRYLMHYNKYASTTVLAASKKQHIVKDEDDDAVRYGLQFSNAAFGVLFSSGLFKQFFNCLGNLDYELSPSLKGEKKYSAESWLEYCCSNSLLKKSDKATLEVTDLYVLGDKKPGMLKRLMMSLFNGKINIPVKRIIAIPVRKDLDKSPFPEVLDNLKDYKIISIGGAEQNIGLQCVINYCAYHSCFDEGNSVGFSENSFITDEKGIRFKMGTEDLVYGTSDETYYGRYLAYKEEANASRNTELIHINIKGNDFYSIYGFSAMATKIGLCVFLHNLLNDIDERVPGKKGELKHLLKYEVSGNTSQKIFRTETGQKFDTEDLMNNPELLSEWLKSSSEKSVEVK